MGKWELWWWEWWRWWQLQSADAHTQKYYYAKKYEEETHSPHACLCLATRIKTVRSRKLCFNLALNIRTSSRPQCIYVIKNQYACFLWTCSRTAKNILSVHVEMILETYWSWTFTFTVAQEQWLRSKNRTVGGITVSSKIKNRESRGQESFFIMIEISESFSLLHGVEVWYN